MFFIWLIGEWCVLCKFVLNCTVFKGTLEKQQKASNFINQIILISQWSSFWPRIRSPRRTFTALIWSHWRLLLPYVLQLCGRPLFSFSFLALQKLEYLSLYMILCFAILFTVKCKYFKGYFDSKYDKRISHLFCVCDLKFSSKRISLKF